jgi:hypothetical protein
VLSPQKSCRMSPQLALHKFVMMRIIFAFFMLGALGAWD